MKNEKLKVKSWRISHSSLSILHWRFLCVLATLLGALVTSSCRQQMAEQPRYDPLEPSTFFADGQSARPLVPGTVAHDEPLKIDIPLYTGKVGDKFADAFPFPVTLDTLKRGRERYDIFCSPCHSRLGDGNGMIVRRGYTHPSSFHTDRLREVPTGYFFTVITDGFGAMPTYAAQIPPQDRWAIIAYIRALQLSQHATLAEVPPEERQKLGQ
jgi:mono/diheme cytochrome c family protein